MGQGIRECVYMKRDKKKMTDNAKDEGVFGVRQSVPGFLGCWC
jgi:hypothetical protein